jgi:short subunit dehydrogenase-like uncharacterized protein
MTDTDKLDTIVFGATGFTGKLVCEYLSKTYGRDENIHWGIAGRNRDKLNAVTAELGLGDIPLFIVDVEDKVSLDAMASACKVVLNTAGPYAKYGSNVVESCARLGTDHVDLNGEPLWMYEVLNQYEDMAQESGARIVFSCGFDSIPTDLGVQFLQEQAQSRFGRPLTRVKGRVKQIKGGASGGSVASFGATMEAMQARPELFAVMTNAFSLTPGFEGPEQPAGNEKIFEEDLNSWSGPFIMATINSKNLHRSNLLLGHPYGKDFVYDEMQLLGDNPDNESVRQALEMNMDLKPGEGPSKEQQQAGFYEIWYIGSNSEGDSLTAIVTGDKDPGYGSTSGLVAEAAICLSQKPKDKEGGILTPAAAMGAELRERVQANAGLTFTLSE